MNFSKIKKIAVGVIALLALIVAYVAYEHSGIVQSQREAEFRAAEAQRERENREAFSAYLDSHIPADTYKLLASINGHSVLMTDGKAEVSYRVLFDFEIPYVAEMVIPVIQDATVETGIPLNTLSVQCYAESNQNGIEDGSMVSWRTHDLVSGTFVSGPDDYLMPGATMDDLMSYYADEAALIDRILGRDTLEEDTTESSDPSELERFGSLLEPYQGEWKSLKSDWHLLINGNHVCSAYYQNYGDTVTEPMSQYQFAFDEDGELVVMQYSIPKYTYTIGENGHLYSQQITQYTPITNEYEKISNNTQFPATG